MSIVNVDCETVIPDCSFTRLTVVYMAGILIASGQLVVLDTEEFRGHITISTSVNAMLLGFFLSDNRATIFWRTRLRYCSDRLRWRWAACLDGPGARSGGGGADNGDGRGGGGGLLATNNRISTTNSVNLQPMMELCVRDLP